MNSSFSCYHKEILLMWWWVWEEKYSMVPVTRSQFLIAPVSLGCDLHKCFSVLFCSPAPFPRQTGRLKGAWVEYFTSPRLDSKIPGGRALVKLFLLRAGLVKQNRMRWEYFKIALSPSPTRNTRGFSSDLSCEKLIGLPEVKRAEVWLSPSRSFYLWLVHTEPLAIGHLHIGFPTLVLVPAPGLLSLRICLFVSPILWAAVFPVTSILWWI